MVISRLRKDLLQPLIDDQSSVEAKNCTSRGGLPTKHLLLGRCQHWVSTPTKGDTALEGVDTYQRRYCLARCQHLARQYLLW